MLHGMWLMPASRLHCSRWRNPAHTAESTRPGDHRALMSIVNKSMSVSCSGSIAPDLIGYITLAFVVGVFIGLVLQWWRHRKAAHVNAEDAEPCSAPLSRASSGAKLLELSRSGHQLSPAPHSSKIGTDFEADLTDMPQSASWPSSANNSPASSSNLVFRFVNGHRKLQQGSTSLSGDCLSTTGQDQAFWEVRSPTAAGLVDERHSVLLRSCKPGKKAKSSGISSSSSSSLRRSQQSESAYASNTPTSLRSSSTTNMTHMSLRESVGLDRFNSKSKTSGSRSPSQLVDDTTKAFSEGEASKRRLGISSSLPRAQMSFLPPAQRKTQLTNCQSLPDPPKIVIPLASARRSYSVAEAPAMQKENLGVVPLVGIPSSPPEFSSNRPRLSQSQSTGYDNRGYSLATEKSILADISDADDDVVEPNSDTGQNAANHQTQAPQPPEQQAEQTSTQHSVLPERSISPQPLIRFSSHPQPSVGESSGKKAGARVLKSVSVALGSNEKYCRQEDDAMVSNACYDGLGDSTENLLDEPNPPVLTKPYHPPPQSAPSTVPSQMFSFVANAKRPLPAVAEPDRLEVPGQTVRRAPPRPLPCQRCRTCRCCRSSSSSDTSNSHYVRLRPRLSSPSTGRLHLQGPRQHPPVFSPRERMPGTSRLSGADPAVSRTRSLRRHNRRRLPTSAAVLRRSPSRNVPPRPKSMKATRSLHGRDGTYATVQRRSSSCNRVDARRHRRACRTESAATSRPPQLQLQRRDATNVDLESHSSVFALGSQSMLSGGLSSTHGLISMGSHDYEPLDMVCGAIAEEQEKEAQVFYSPKKNDTKRPSPMLVICETQSLAPAKKWSCSGTVTIPPLPSLKDL